MKPHGAFRAAHEVYKVNKEAGVKESQAHPTILTLALHAILTLTLTMMKAKRNAPAASSIAAAKAQGAGMDPDIEMMQAYQNRLYHTSVGESRRHYGGMGKKLLKTDKKVKKKTGKAGDWDQVAEAVRKIPYALCCK